MDRLSEIPELPASKHIDACLEIVSTNDTEIIQRRITAIYDRSILDRYPPFVLTAIHKSFYYLSGGMGFVMDRAEKLEGDSLLLVLRNKLMDRYIGIELAVSSEPPHKIVKMLNYRNIDKPPLDNSHLMYPDDLITQKLEQCIDKMNTDELFSGAVILVKNEDILLRKACGMANRSFMVPNLMDTKFNIASMGKMFMGVAVAQLAEQGKIHFADTVDKYVPSDWLESALARKIQIQHLLTHTSGLGDYFALIYQKHPMKYYRNLDDYHSLFREVQLDFEPGTRWSYSNMGMLLLGVVIEQVTGASYEDYIEKHIYSPAGMVNSGAFELDHVIPNLATGYSRFETPEGILWRNNRVKLVLKGSPSGGSYSTVDDMLGFDRALRNHVLLKQETVDVVQSAKPALNSPFYGYGFFVSESASGRCFSHGGDGRGINCQFRSYPDRGYTLVALSNTDPPGANIISDVCDALLVNYTAVV